MNRNAAHPIRQLTLEEFPPLLREITDAPKRLFSRGDVSSNNLKYLAVVGSRSCSQYGRDVVRFLIQGLSGYPITIVSGLALGIDSDAHKAALDAGLRTIGVPGSGLEWEVLYPRSSISLAHDILDQGGGLLSEFEPLTRAAHYTFPQRNRIMAGMAHAVLVIEAQEKSGSLITARLAAEYNRELLVVPGSIFSTGSAGTHQFLKLGATPVTDTRDIVLALGLEEDGETRCMVNNSLTKMEQSCIEVMTSPTDVNTLQSLLMCESHELFAVLTSLEMKGLVTTEFGIARRK